MFDIDETSLSNYQNMFAASFGGAPKYIHNEINKVDDPPISATLKLYNFAKVNPVAVFFITSRNQSLQYRLSKI